MNCDNCKTGIKIKDTQKWISLMCQCGITIHYPNRITKFISKEDYDANYKKR